MPLLAVLKFDILVMENCRIYSVQLFCWHCVRHNPLRCHIEPNHIYINFFMYLCCFQGCQCTRCLDLCVPVYCPSVQYCRPFDYLWCSLAAPCRATFPAGLWPSFSSHRLPSNKFMFFYFLLTQFYTQIHMLTHTHTYTHILTHIQVKKVFGHFSLLVYFSLFLLPV